jgi:transposase
MTTRQRRYYPEVLKRHAVALVTEQGYSIAEAARNLDVGANLLERLDGGTTYSLTEPASGKLLCCV